MPTYIGDTKNKWYLGNNKIKKIYLGNAKIYSAGNIVTYMVDSDVVYQEEIDEGLSCLSPTTFTPTKSGWTFKGWRSTANAIPEVYSSLIMGDTEITLYAVFQRDVTVSYSGNGATGGGVESQHGYRYYNNGNIANPSFTLSYNNFSRTGYAFTKWSMGSTEGIQYTAGTTVTLSDNAIMYAVWLDGTVFVGGLVFGTGDSYDSHPENNPVIHSNIDTSIWKSATVTFVSLYSTTMHVGSETRHYLEVDSSNRVQFMYSFRESDRQDYNTQNPATLVFNKTSGMVNLSISTVSTFDSLLSCYGVVTKIVLNAR